MFNTGIYSLRVLLLHGNIIIGLKQGGKVLFNLENGNNYDTIGGYVTDSIGELCTGNRSLMTTPQERQQFIAWFNLNINNIKEIYEPLQIQETNKVTLANKGTRFPRAW